MTAPSLATWVQFLNSQDLDTGRACLTDASVVIAFPEGADGESTTYEGFDAIAGWVTHPPLGRFEMTLLETTVGLADRRLPSADETISGRYSVTIVDTEWAGWTNHGTWTFALKRGRIVGVVHCPETLTEEQHNYLERSS